MLSVAGGASAEDRPASRHGRPRFNHIARTVPVAGSRWWMPVSSGTPRLPLHCSTSARKLRGWRGLNGISPRLRTGPERGDSGCGGDSAAGLLLSHCARSLRAAFVAACSQGGAGRRAGRNRRPDVLPGHRTGRANGQRTKKCGAGVAGFAECFLAEGQALPRCAPACFLRSSAERPPVVLPFAGGCIVLRFTDAVQPDENCYGNGRFQEVAPERAPLCEQEQVERVVPHAICVLRRCRP